MIDNLIELRKFLEPILSLEIEGYYTGRPINTLMRHFKDELPIEEDRVLDVMGDEKKAIKVRNMGKKYASYCAMCVKAYRLQNAQKGTESAEITISREYYSELRQKATLWDLAVKYAESKTKEVCE